MLLILIFSGVPKSNTELYDIYTVSQKNKTPNSCPQLHQILTDFKTFFH